MSGAQYLSKPAKRQSSSARKIVPALAFVLAFVVGLFSLGTGLFVKPHEAQAGPLEWVVCEWAGEDSLVYFAYQVAFTDNIAYQVASKSAVSGGTDDVTGFPNAWLITQDFKSVNEQIMGTGLTADSDFTGSINGGTKVNPYDRFGVAGLYWSSYSGEWNYLKVNVCSSSEPVNMRIGAFYDGRLAPLSTYGGVAQSTDIRSVVAANKGLVVAHDWVNILANGIFNITKFLVVVTNTLIGLAFTDIISAVGLTDLIGSEGGLFEKFYNGIYLPLILIIMLVMAVWAFWNGIVKRAYRRTLAGIAQSVVLYITAAVIAFFPLFFISLPNNIAVVGQSLLVNTMSTSLYGGDGLCSVGGVYVTNAAGERVLATPDGDGNVSVDPGGSPAVTDVEGNLNFLEQATQSMQSVIGCQLWYTYVLQPWTRGQFGTDFQNLWAKGHSDTAIFSEAKELPNDNEAWVGDAAVPLGGGYTINNWALFQISTQTNAHVPLGQEEPMRSTYTDGVANDWWRIVDAVSNYNETKQQNGIPTGSACTDTTVIEGSGHCNPSFNSEDTQPVESTIPDTSKKPTDYWQNWIGAKPGDRMMAAIGSVFPALLGNLAPIVFAGMSAVMSIGLAVVMAVAPIFFLIGSWPGNGWNIFKSWGQLVLNLTIKRIILGFLLVVSIIFISMVLNLTKDLFFINWVILAVVSIALIKFRNQIFDKLSGILSFNFANSDLGAGAAGAWNKFKSGTGKAVGFGGRMATAGVLGGMVAQKAGTDVTKGIAKGWKQELRNTVYRSPTLNQAWSGAEAASKDRGKFQKVDKRTLCPYCNRPLVREDRDQAVFNGGIDDDGNFVCETCMSNPTGTPTGLNPYEFGAKRTQRDFIQDEKELKGLSLDDVQAVKKRQRRSVNLDESTVESAVNDAIKELKFRDEKTGEVFDNVPDVVAAIFTRELNMARVNGTVPEVPKELVPYMTPEAQQVMPQLWRDPNPQAVETIALAYSHALVQYSYDKGELQVGDISGDINEGVKGDVQQVLGTIVKQINQQELDRNGR